MEFLNDLSRIISPIFYKLLYLSITATIIGFVLLLIRKLTDKKISPHWKYFMWVCFVAALVVPFRLPAFGCLGYGGFSSCHAPKRQ